jgi:hypothetical protein
MSERCFESGVVERQTPPEGCWFALGLYGERNSFERAEELAVPLRPVGTVETTDDPQLKGRKARGEEMGGPGLENAELMVSGVHPA